MKYAQQIQQYQLNHEADSKTENATEHPLIQNWNEEPKDDHPRDPLTGAQLKDIDPEFEETQEAPKKKRGRPVGSKNKKTKKETTSAPVTKKQPEKRRPRSPRVNETALSIGMSQQLFDDIENAATHNFRTLTGEVCWVLTQYYNGKL